ncbi:MAG: phosphoribosyltransferase [Pseudomonadota bacterium]
MRWNFGHSPDMAQSFRDREDAGEQLAHALSTHTIDNPVVYALPRGGLPVANIVARSFNAPLEIILVRKLGAPGRPELAIGAIVDGASPIFILHNDIVQTLGVTKDYIQNVKTAALAEIERRRKLYLKDRPALSPKGREVIVVDDGLATGATMEAAIQALREAGASRIVAAVPVAPSDTLLSIQKIADDVVCLHTPTPFFSVGDYYRSFPQLTDADVIDTLHRRP